MIELELLGANGDRVVMTDADGQRYEIVVDDALRGAVRRARPTVLAPVPEPTRSASVRPRDLQALMRAGASAQEVATATGTDLEHVRRFEGPVLAERAWAVEQARSCRIGWGKDSPVLGDLVLDRLATRGVSPTSLSWDSLRHGREPWQIVLTFVQGAEEKEARWELDLSSHAVVALDDEARWLTEAAAARRARVTTLPGAASAGEALTDDVFDQDAPAAPSRREADGARSSEASRPGHRATATQEDQTQALLDSLSAARGQRIQPEVPEPTGALATLPGPTDEPGSPAAPDQDSPVDAATVPADTQEEHGPSSADGGLGGDRTDDPSSQTAPVVPMRRSRQVGHHPAGSKLGPLDEPLTVTQTATVVPPATGAPRTADHHPSFESIVTGVTDVVARAKASQPAEPEEKDPATGAQTALPHMPDAPVSKPRAKRRPRRSVPSWDEIVFGAKPE